MKSRRNGSIINSRFVCSVVFAISATVLIYILFSQTSTRQLNKLKTQSQENDYLDVALYKKNKREQFPKMEAKARRPFNAIRADINAKAAKEHLAVNKLNIGGGSDNSGLVLKAANDRTQQMINKMHGPKVSANLAFGTDWNDKALKSALPDLIFRRPIAGSSSFFTKMQNLDRIVHFDLKGSQPKKDYFISVIGKLKEWGATGILIEYEDTFPYSADIDILRSGTAYSKEELQEILDTAKKEGLSVTPLIQTMGHMEFVLKHNKFKDLREVADIPQAINPCKAGAFELLTTILDQTIEFHKQMDLAKRVHIGADEVYFIGQSPECKEFISREAKKNPKFNKSSLFMYHVARIARYIKKKHPDTEVLMWDDLLRSLSPANIQSFKLPELVTPVVWNYIPDVAIKEKLFANYSEAGFPKTFAGSSFKGASGIAQYLTAPAFHIANHLSWLEMMQKVSQKLTSLEFSGTILTGWSRFDHFAVPCELFPVAIPSLAMSLQALQTGGFSTNTLNTVMKKLQCSSKPPLIRTNFYFTEKQLENGCQFPGDSIYRDILKYHNQRRRFDYITITTAGREAGYLTQYQIQRSFSSQTQLRKVQGAFKQISANLTQLRPVISDHLLTAFKPDTVEEWLSIYIDEILDRINGLNSKISRVMNVNVWPARPLRRQSEPSDKKAGAGGDGTEKVIVQPAKDMADDDASEVVKKGVDLSGKELVNKGIRGALKGVNGAVNQGGVKQRQGINKERDVYKQKKKPTDDPVEVERRKQILNDNHHVLIPHAAKTQLLKEQFAQDRANKRGRQKAEGVNLAPSNV